MKDHLKQLHLLWTLMLLALTLGVQAQGKYSEIKNQIWNNSDPLAQVVDFPERWQDESAVVLYQDYQYTYAFKGGASKLERSRTIHRRIKLLDKSAVESYSEFSVAERFQVQTGFSSKGGRAFAGFKVIKPSGEERVIDMSNAVELDSDNKEQLKKIAISDLEPGDILDYFYHIVQPILANRIHLYDPVYATLGWKYPILFQCIRVEANQRHYMNVNMTNDGPEPEILDHRPSKKSFLVVDKEREKIDDDVRWYNESKENPQLKFQVGFSLYSSYAKYLSATFGSENEVKTELDNVDFKTYYAERLAVDESIEEMNRHAARAGNIKDNQREYLEAAYYYFRNEYLVKHMEYLRMVDEGIMKPFSEEAQILNDLGFVRYYGSFLKKNNIDFEVLLAMSKYQGRMDEVLHIDELELMLKVNADTTYYLAGPSLHTDFNQIPTYYEGTKALAMTMFFNIINMVKKVEETTIPYSSLQENTGINYQDIHFLGEHFDSLSLFLTVELLGHQKASHRNNIIAFYNFVDEDKAIFEWGTAGDERLKTKSEDQFPSYNGRDFPKAALPKIEALREDDEKIQRERVRNRIQNDLDLPIKDGFTFRVEDFGRFGASDTMRYTASFRTEELVHQAGDHYVLDVGRLIGGQVGLEKSEMERSEDIYMPYARGYKNEIRIHIPDGYEVVGAERLQKEVSNECGGFISSARVRGNELLISTHKYYRHNYEPAANWPKMVAFLEVAYQFTQEKVLLRKIGS